MKITIRVDPRVAAKARRIAAQRSISIGDLVAERIQSLVEDDEAYDIARREAVKLLKRGWHLGGEHKMDRDTLHERG